MAEIRRDLTYVIRVTNEEINMLMSILAETSDEHLEDEVRVFKRDLGRLLVDKDE